MATPQEQAATQLANIEERLGRRTPDLADEAAAAGLVTHGEMMTWAKGTLGLTHGHANRLVHAIREHLAGGPADDADLLDAQYAGAKSHLRSVLDELVAVADALGDDVDIVVQKTGVSLRRVTQFGVVRAASSKRVELGLNLPTTPDDDRVRRTTGMCSHRVDLAVADDVDDDVAGWLREGYLAAG